MRSRAARSTRMASPLGNPRASGRDRCLGRGALSVTYLHMLFDGARSSTHTGAYV